MEILGNKKNLALLKEAADKDRLSHAYLISGPAGSGKMTFAENAAAALLCENRKKLSSLKPCGSCPSCKRALSGNHPDIIKVEHEKENTLSVDEIRSFIVRDIDIKPYYGPYKIYIVDDAHLMHPQAQNAMLKTLEEPPSFALILLLADNADVLLDTVRSRSIRLEMELLESHMIEEKLKAYGEPAKDAAEISSFCAGNLGMALKINKDEDAKELLSFLTNLLSEIEEKDAAGLYAAAKILSENTSLSAADIIRKWYRDILLLKACGSPKLYFPGSKAALLKKSESMSYESINDIFIKTDEACERLKFNVNPAAVYEALLLGIRNNG